MNELIEKYLKVLLLDSNQTITLEDIDNNFKKLSKIYHPDVCIKAYKDGKMFILITEAKNYLSENITDVNQYILSRRNKNEQTINNSRTDHISNPYHIDNTNINLIRIKHIDNIKNINNLYNDRLINDNVFYSMIESELIKLKSSFLSNDKLFISIIFSFISYIIFFICSCTIIVAERFLFSFIDELSFMDISSGLLGIVAILTAINFIICLIIKNKKIIKFLFIVSFFYLLVPILNIFFPFDFICCPGDYMGSIFIIIVLLILVIISYIFVLYQLNNKTNKDKNINLNINEYGYYLFEFKNLLNLHFINEYQYNELISFIDIYK